MCVFVVGCVQVDVASMELHPDIQTKMDAFQSSYAVLKKPRKLVRVGIRAASFMGGREQAVFSYRGRDGVLPGVPNDRTLMSPSRAGVAFRSGLLTWAPWSWTWRSAAS